MELKIDKTVLRRRILMGIKLIESVYSPALLHLDWRKVDLTHREYCIPTLIFKDVRSAWLRCRGEFNPRMIETIDEIYDLFEAMCLYMPLDRHTVAEVNAAADIWIEEMRNRGIEDTMFNHPKEEVKGGENENSQRSGAGEKRTEGSRTDSWVREVFGEDYN